MPDPLAPMLGTLFDPTLGPPIWAAVAAASSALAAFLTWRAQVKTLRHTFRPDLVLTDWRRLHSDLPGEDILCFSGVKNVGRDMARHVYIHAVGQADDERPTYFMGTLTIPAIEHGQTIQVDGRIRLHWNNVARFAASHKSLRICVKMRCIDPLDVRHETQEYVVVASRLDAPLFGAPAVASGAYAVGREMRSISSFRGKFNRAVARFPGLRRLTNEPRYD